MRITRKMSIRVIIRRGEMNEINEIIKLCESCLRGDEYVEDSIVREILDLSLEAKKSIESNCRISEKKIESH